MSAKSHQSVPVHHVSAKAREIFDWSDRLMSQCDVESAWPLAEGSSLMLDDDQTKPYHLSHAVRQLIHSSAEHLHAVKCIVQDAAVIHTRAEYTLVRGALESTAVALWLIRPASRDERVLRLLRYHYTNAHDGDKIRAEGVVVPRTLEEKLFDLRAVATTAGIDPGSVDKRVNSSAAVQEAQRDTEWHTYLAWQVCSAMAHGRWWPMMPMSGSEERIESEDGVVSLRLTGKLTMLVWALNEAQKSLEMLLRIFHSRRRPPH